MLKKDIRRTYLEKRKTLSNDEVFLLSKLIFERFKSYFDIRPGDKIHIFLTIDKLKEIQTFQFIEYCWEHQIRIFVPKMIGDELISLEINKETPLEINGWGIMEPVGDIDAGFVHYDYVITPLLYCDGHGNRVGYGKGFYDKLFASLDSRTKKIGVNYFTPTHIVEDTYNGDILLDYLVTPTEVLSFFKSL